MYTTFCMDIRRTFSIFLEYLKVGLLGHMLSLFVVVVVCLFWPCHVECKILVS